MDEMSNAQDKSSDARLAALEARYSEQHAMLGEPMRSPGYHTTLSSGVWVHPTRESLDYALLLLDVDDKHRHARAGCIIDKVISLQSTDPYHPTYGIWPWFLEEPLEQMAPPDWNWADFCGARLAQLLVEHAQKLPGELTERMRTALGHAASAIFRRNVQPGYSNIAIMGGMVTAAAGEILNEPRLLAYGRRRLSRIVEHTQYHGGFNEYNSPTYTLVVLLETERGLQMVADSACREAAEALRQIAWQTIAEHFHPPTQQWAGPHARAYTDRLTRSAVETLAERTGLSFALHPTMRSDNADVREAGVRPLPCPDSWRPCFERLGSAEQQIQRCFHRDKDGTASTTGTTWLHEQACLGSINREHFWTQRRPVIGYWTTSDDPAVVLRVRFLKDDQDFASAMIHTTQEGPRLVALVGTRRNGGDYHVHLDRPADGVFRAADLRLRIEVVGKAVSGKSLGGGRIAISAGDWQAIVHIPQEVGQFLGETPQWACRELEDRTVADAVIYQGSEREIPLAHVDEPTWLAFGLELLPTTATVSTTAVVATPVEGGRVTVDWPLNAPLHVTGPAGPVNTA